MIAIVMIVVLVLIGIVISAILAPIALGRANKANRRAAGLERRLFDQNNRLDQAMTRLDVMALELNRPRAAGHVAEAVEQSEAEAEPARSPEPPAMEHKASDPLVAEGEQTESESEAGAVAEQAEPAHPVGAEGASEIRAGEAVGVDNPARSAIEALRAAHERVQGQVEAEQVAGTQPQAVSSGVGGDCEHEPSRRLTIEEVLAGKVFVWIGAVALVLTAAFLLKLGFDRGIITEPVRVIGAGVFGLALWCVGEWARTRVALIGQVLCGAGVAVLYATVLAGHNLYGLFGAHGGAIAFVLMALITAAAVLLSLRHGPAVAVLGMIGGFMLPPVLSMGFTGPTGGMVLYLLALEVGILAVTGRRGWFGISALTLGFTVLWSVGYTLIGDSAYQRTLTAMLVVGTAVAYLVQTARLHRDPGATRGTRMQVLGMSIAAVCSAVVVVAMQTHAGGFMPNDLWMLGLLAAGTVVLARLDGRYRYIPFVVMGLSLMVLLSGAGAAGLNPTPTRASLTATAVGYGALFMLGGYVCLWRSDHRRVFTLLSVLAGPAYLATVVILHHQAMGWREAWWPYTLGLAGLYAAGAWPMLRGRRAVDDWPISALLLTSYVLACAALMQGLNHPRIAVCLSLVAAAAALVDRRLFVRPLLVASYVTAACAALWLVIPGPFMIEIRGAVVLNTLLPVYTLAALGFGLIAWCADRAGEARAGRNLTWLTVGTLAVLLILMTRDGFHPERFTTPGFDLYEWSTYACVLMLSAMGGLWLAGRFRIEAVREAAVCVGGIGAVAGLFGGLVTGNPLWDDSAEGGAMLALGLVGLYVVPAALMVLLARRRALDEQPQLRSALRVMAVTLVAVFAGLQVRNAFHTDDLHAHALGMFECVTAAVVWMVLGVAFQLASWLSPEPVVLRRAGKAVFGLGLATTLIGNVLVLNPLWTDNSVGSTPVLNGLWLLYGPGVIGLALLARRWRKSGEVELAKVAGFAAIGLGFMVISLFVRQAFSGDGVLLIDGRPNIAERYGYSLAWVLFGGVLLVAGVFTRLDTLRYGSLAALLIAVGKVFLIDTASLENLYRVFSFFGLGVTLVGLGYLYQRLVFRRPGPTHNGEPTT